MGNLEKHAKNRLRKGQIESIILGALLVSGAMVASGSKHNMLKVLKRVDRRWFNKRDPRQRIRETTSKLKQKGLIEFKTIHGRLHMQLTSRGAGRVRQIQHGAICIPKPKKWDGQWRIVIFDIPEKKKILRDRVRAVVSRLGFYRLQDSVWVHPYECEEIITLFKTDLQIGKDLLYIIGAAIEFDRPLRQHFKLPL